MAASQFNRYIWLVDTIRRAGRISRQDIDRRWANSSLNDRKETCIPERTFHRYKDAIQELFDIEIRCDRAAGGLYYIAGTGNESRTKQWLLSQFAVSNSLHESRQLQGRVLYESIPRGTEYLTQIVPLHHSQKEEQPCVFSWFVAPTFDFFMELRTHGSNLEVLSPAWLREEFREDAEKTVLLYKKV